ncbi:hypothetical protein QJS10_CPA03g00859 [Acorus calamus]|uniref:Uncharacterized protein n=1 Tax=Acorus calamus TaxID=4465 RepID=A0AAV9F8H3_ACOCL|nr:hypothetical protein QJS10_CPA03g00859 [Acorus calamus]
MDISTIYRYTDIDDWLPHFVVLHGSCIVYYINSTGESVVKCISSRQNQQTANTTIDSSHALP